MLMIDRLCCKSKLGNHVLCILEVAVVGIVLGGDIDIIRPSYTIPIVLDVKAICLKRWLKKILLLSLSGKHT